MVCSDPQQIKVDIHHRSMVYLVMLSLKAFIYGLGPIVGMGRDALYERQRALVKLGLLTATPGRGPGSGVPLTADNVAALIISVMAAATLSDVDERVVALCNAPPDLRSPDGWKEKWWKELGKPTFRSEVSRLLSGSRIQWDGSARTFRGIRVSRCWRGQILPGRAVRPIDFFVDESERETSNYLISITAEIESEMLENLIAYTKKGLSLVVEADGDDQ